MAFGKTIFTTNHINAGINTNFHINLNSRANKPPNTHIKGSPINRLLQCSMPHFQYSTAWPHSPVSMASSTISQLNARMSIIRTNFCHIILEVFSINISKDPIRIPEKKCCTDHKSNIASCLSPMSIGASKQPKIKICILRC